MSLEGTYTVKTVEFLDLVKAGDTIEIKQYSSLYGIEQNPPSLDHHPTWGLQTCDFKGEGTIYGGLPFSIEMHVTNKVKRITCTMGQPQLGSWTAEDDGSAPPAFGVPHYLRHKEPQA